jgi:hypothetical protein
VVLFSNSFKETQNIHYHKQEFTDSITTVFGFQRISNFAMAELLGPIWTTKTWKFWTHNFCYRFRKRKFDLRYHCLKRMPHVLNYPLYGPYTIDGFIYLHSVGNAVLVICLPLSVWQHCSLLSKVLRLVAQKRRFVLRTKPSIRFR